MQVDHDTVLDALERCDWEIPGQPEVEVILSEPDEQGRAEMTLEGPGSFHCSPETVVRAIGVVELPLIDRYTPSTIGYVVNEPGRPPSPRAAAASKKPKGRTGHQRPPARPPEPSDLLEANVASPRRPRRRKSA